MSCSQRLLDFVDQHPRLLILTGAGISVAEGIPTYRDDAGNWARSDPIQHREFLEQASSRQRYWARSIVGWPMVAQARPTAAHEALANLEQSGHCGLLVTQNVDRLHQRAGHRRVIDLHGRLDRVVCLECHRAISREDMQDELLSLNPALANELASALPDGDAAVADELVARCQVPDCQFCGGLLMPDVVFFGGSVPRTRVDEVYEALADSNALLCVGSSLMVFSGFRFCREAHRQAKPIALVNRGQTRADELASLKLEADCQSLLPELVQALNMSASASDRPG